MDISTEPNTDAPVEGAEGYVSAYPQPMNAPAPPAEATPEAPVEQQAEPTDEPDTFPRDYVVALRKEAAEARVKAKVTDHANERLLAAYATQDGRLAAVDVLAVSGDLLGTDGLVDPQRVTDHIGAVLAERPYLAQRRAAPLPAGVRPDVTPEVGWLDILRGGSR